MPGARWPWRMIGLGLAGVAAVTLAVPAILLARGTTSHDWYAAGKLTAVEVALAVGFSEYTAVAYRRADGDIWNIVREVFVEFGPPVLARQRILSLAGDGVMLGAGVGGIVFCLMLLGAARDGRRGRTGTALEPVERLHRLPPTAGPAGRIPGWIGPGLRTRIALLVVSPAELERLLTQFDDGPRPGFIDLPEPDSTARLESDGGLPEDGGADAARLVAQSESLPPTRAPSLPWPEHAEPAPKAPAPANPALAKPESRRDADEPEGTDGDGAAARRREPGEEFF
ncbi:MAG: hypothetical protein F4018_05460 [Acidobacteria bacterium]|nr:hypothetical protein [Acidobacteriota bacterium]